MKTLFTTLRSSMHTLAAAAIAIAAVSGVYAVPVTSSQARQAAAIFAAMRYPATNALDARLVTEAGTSRVAVADVEALDRQNQLIGYVVWLEPAGYVLLRPDTEQPPIKLYSDEGAYTNLPPEFVKVIELELAEEAGMLAQRSGMGSTMVFADQWTALLEAKETKGVCSPGVVLLTTTWNQGDPYNYYCPTASGGPGGRAYAGCTACALGQILRYHNKPVQVATDHTYTDNSGLCQGTHRISDAGMGAYDWANMPSSISASSILAQKQAVGTLLYHCAVALESDFEANGTSAYPSDIAPVLATYFGYTSGSYEAKSSHTSSQWYGQISADVDANKPVFYAMWQADWSAGHAVVCDGYRNGNEIHLNLGWSGSGNAWYNIDSVNCGSYTWVIHGAVFGIAPGGGPAPANDNFVGAEVLSANSGTRNGTSSGATVENGEPAHAGCGPYKSIWYRFTPSQDGTLTIDTHGSSFDTVLALYTGSAVNNLTGIASNDDDDSDNNNSGLTDVALTAGVIYRVAVAGYSDGSYGSTTLNWTFTPGSGPTPANDNFASAEVLSASSGTRNGTSSGATVENGEPAHAGCGPYRSVWYRYTPAENGYLVVNTHGSAFDTVLAVYRGTSLACLTCIASNDDDGSANSNSGIMFVRLEAGVTYRFAVAGHNSTSAGAIQLNWAFYPTVTIGNRKGNMNRTMLTVYNDGLLARFNAGWRIAMIDGEEVVDGSHQLVPSRNLRHWRYNERRSCAINYIVRTRNSNKLTYTVWRYTSVPAVIVVPPDDHMLGTGTAE